MMVTSEPRDRVPSAFAMEVDMLNEELVLLRSPWASPPSIIKARAPPKLPSFHYGATNNILLLNNKIDVDDDDEADVVVVVDLCLLLNYR